MYVEDNKVVRNCQCAIIYIDSIFVNVLTVDQLKNHVIHYQLHDFVA